VLYSRQQTDTVMGGAHIYVGMADNTGHSSNKEV